ncbi:MAG: radical SAM protein [Candidatus Helarchaeota archaeon]|nr:radical SAM protein [Candidatus Helarchaeota archaeon]
MSFISQLFQKLEEDVTGKQSLQLLLNCNEEMFSELLSAAWKIRQKNFKPVLDCFFPGDNFPAISITGTQCALQCKHCNKHYLSLMIPAETPTKLWDACKKLDRDGKVGCLISGGYNEEAMLPFSKFLPTLKKIKQETNLILNVHTGLISEELAMQLGEIGIDIVSFDIVGDKQTIQEVYGLDKTPDNYLQSLKFLKKSKIPYIVPHVCIGLNQGVYSGEIRALNLIKSSDPYLIVLLGLIPTINTPMQDITPNAQNIAKFIAITRLLFPNTPISLGCMRPGKKIRNQIDLYAIQAGINRIEIPTRKAIHYATKNGLQIQNHKSCCAVPLELL